MTRTETLNIIDRLQRLAGPLSASPDKKEMGEYVAEELYKLANELFESHVEDRKRSYDKLDMVA